MELTRVDTAQINDDDFSEAYKRWISGLVDALNSTITQIEDALNSLDERVTNLGG